MRFFSSSEKQTFAFAKNFSKTLRGGEVIGLIGDLGAGKTVFAKGLAAGLGVKKTVSSPTFVLMRVYPTESAAIKQLIHIDAYRIKSARDLIAVGAQDYFGRAGTVCLVEWADKIKKILPAETRFIKISIKYNLRSINF